MALGAIAPRDRLRVERLEHERRHRRAAETVQHTQRAGHLEREAPPARFIDEGVPVEMLSGAINHTERVGDPMAGLHRTPPQSVETDVQQLIGRAQNEHREGAVLELARGQGPRALP